MTHDSDQAVLTLMKTSDVIESDFLTVNPHDSLEQLVRVVQESNRNLFPVTDTEGCLQGIVSLDDMRSIMFRRELYGKVLVYELMQRPIEYVFIEERM